VIGRLLERNPRFSNWLYGFTPPERGTVELVHRRVYILPARLGWFFAGTLLVLLVGSINYALSLGFALTFACRPGSARRHGAYHATSPASRSR
jgi:hypothetical protein